MPIVFREEYYDAVRPYLPEDARRILENQLPVIKKNIEAELDTFSKLLAAEIDKELEKLKTDIVTEVGAASERLRKIAEIVPSAGASAEQIRNATDALSKEMDEYKAKVKSWGEAARKAVVTAAKGAGLPIPG